MNTKTYIFDFDYTLFDTKMFRSHLAQALSLSDKKYADTYKKIFKNKNIHYDAKKHIEFLVKERLVKKESKEILNKSLKAFLSQADNFIFKDAYKVLKKLKKKGDKLILLTLGDKKWQKQKIKNTKIEKYFDKIVYLQKDKATYLKKIEKNLGEIIIVNDNARECLAIKKKLKDCLIFMVDGPHAHKPQHKFTINKLNDLT